MSASVGSASRVDAAASYRKYSTAIAEYTATVERFRSRRNSVQDSANNYTSKYTPSSYASSSWRTSSSTATGTDTARTISPSRPRSVYSTASSHSHATTSDTPDYRAQLRGEIAASLVSNTKRHSWRSSISDVSALDSARSLETYGQKSAGDVGGSSTKPPYLSRQSSLSSADAVSSYATLPREGSSASRRIYTSEESLEKAREILAASGNRSSSDRKDRSSSSVSERRYSRDYTAPPNGQYDSGVESLDSSRTSSYDRLALHPFTAASSRRSNGISSASSSRLQSREVSPVHQLMHTRTSNTPELQPYGMHRDRESFSPSRFESAMSGRAVSTETKQSGSRETGVHLAEKVALQDSESCAEASLDMSHYPSRSLARSRIDKVALQSLANYNREPAYSTSTGRGTDTEAEDDKESENDWRSKYGTGTGTGTAGLRSRSPRSSRRLSMQPSRKTVNVDESDRAGLTGLKNIGNTCFMNSILQCLSNTRCLRDYCTSGQYEPDLNESSTHRDAPLISAFAAVLEALWKKHSSYSSSNAYDPDRFHRKIQQYAPRFSGYLQQDGQEFLRYLLEGLHEDVNRISEKLKPDFSDIPDHLTDSQKSAEAWKRYLRRDNSRIVDLYVGQLKSSLICDKCGHCSVTFDPFWDLALPIPTNRNSGFGEANIYDCFKSFTKQEVLDGDERPMCSKCKTRQRCTKFFSIQRFPKYLVIHLKRFSQERYRAKISSLVDYPVDGLDLHPFAADQHGNSGPRPVYNLYAVCCHAGSTHCGHYTAFCKHPVSGRWNEYNDSRVTSATSRDAVTSDAYVLFYELAGG